MSHVNTEMKSPVNVTAAQPEKPEPSGRHADNCVLEAVGSEYF